MGDLRACFPHLGTGVFQFWLSKGFLAHDVERRGEKTRVVFNWCEVVHTGVIVQLSLMGVFQASAVDITLDDPADDARIVKGDLCNPRQLIDYYNRYDFDLCVSVYTTFEARDTTKAPLRGRKKGAEIKSRAAQGRIVAVALMGSRDSAGAMFEQWNSDDSVVSTYLSNMGFISVRSTAAHVRRQLGLPSLPRSSQPVKKGCEGC